LDPQSNTGYVTTEGSPVLEPPTSKPQGRGESYPAITFTTSRGAMTSLNCSWKEPSGVQVSIEESEKRGAVGMSVGTADGSGVGIIVGTDNVGDTVGEFVGYLVGALVGGLDGIVVGDGVVNAARLHINLSRVEHG
jgi:hypothetical protein